MVYHKRAFTLIELLVVVLIISVLASVAVSQYQKAVLKSRYSKLKTLVQIISLAQEAYFLSNGTYALCFDQLDIDLEGNTNKSTCNIRYFEEGQCSLNHTSSYFWACGNSQIGMSVQAYGLYDASYPGDILCVIRPDDRNSLQANICKEETGRTSPTHRRADEYAAWTY